MTQNLSTVKSLWNDFKVKALREVKEDSVQMHEMKKAFYVGILSGMKAFEQVGAVEDEDQGVNHLESMFGECKEFFDALIQSGNERN